VCVLCVGQFGVGFVGVSVCVVCGTVWSGFGGVIVCVLYVGQFGVGLWD
jgi:hypothetical protein